MQLEGNVEGHTGVLRHWDGLP